MSIPRCEWCGVQIGSYGQDRNICKKCTERTGIEAFDDADECEDKK